MLDFQDAVLLRIEQIVENIGHSDAIGVEFLYGI